jgi:hypothetical protein
MRRVGDHALRLVGRQLRLELRRHVALRAAGVSIVSTNEPIAARGRDPAGAGVGLTIRPRSSRSAITLRIVAGESSSRWRATGARTDRLAVGDIAFDQRFQQVLARSSSMISL